MDEKKALTYAITRAIAYTENGGKPDIKNPKAGKTGETKSIFQFEPETWKEDAKKILGDENAPITPDNETKVVTEKVSHWIDKGYNAKQIASMWNAGESEPDAYTGKFSTGKSSKGINTKYGVGYDVPGYAEKVANYAKQFYTQDLSKQIAPTPQMQPTQVSQSTPQTTQPSTQSQQSTGNNIPGLINKLAGING